MATTVLVDSRPHEHSPIRDCRWTVHYGGQQWASSRSSDLGIGATAKDWQRKSDPRLLAVDLAGYRRAQGRSLTSGLALDGTDVSQALEELSELSQKHQIIRTETIRIEVHNVISDFSNSV